MHIFMGREPSTCHPMGKESLETRRRVAAVWLRRLESLERSKRGRRPPAQQKSAPPAKKPIDVELHTEARMLALTILGTRTERVDRALVRSLLLKTHPDKPGAVHTHLFTRVKALYDRMLAENL
jgi:hypothetical protein